MKHRPLLGKTERRLALAILVSAIVPLVVATLLARSMFAQASAIWFRPEVGQQLDRGVALYKDYVAATKNDMRHQVELVAADETLRTAVARGDKAEIDAALDVLFPRYPQLLSVAVETEDGTTRGRHDRGRGLDEATERSLDVVRPLRAGESMLLVHAVFAVERARLDELETTGDVVTAYHQIEGSRGELYVGYLYAFAALLGITAVLAALVGTILARGVTRRIVRLAAALDLVGKGELDVRVPVTGSDELTELAETFNHMLAEVAHSRGRIEFLQRVGAWQEMARRLAHEIKNPLTPIQLAVQECHRKYGGEDPRFKALLDTTAEIVEEEIATLRRLVGEFSRFARLPHADLQDADLREFLRDCEQTVPDADADAGGEPSPAGGGLEVDSPVEVVWDAGSRPLPVSIDAQMLRRVVVNLVRNAVQAIREARVASGEPLLPAPGSGRTEHRGKVRVSARGDGDGAAIVVEDDGPGVEKDQRDKVFDPYFTTKAGGTGLGLAIVQKVVLEHGGSVEVGTSELGGARFVVYLPPRRNLALEAVRAARERALREGVRAPA